MHTPGPWFISQEGGMGLAICTESCGRHCCIAQAHDSVVIPEAEANARLIAAAPELLAALVAIAGMAIQGQEPGRNAQAYLDAIEARAGAAIAAAREEG